MSIKYAEFTMILDLEKESMTNYLSRILFGNENKELDYENNYNIIILFDDETIYDIKDKIINTKSHNIFKMGPAYFARNNIPIYFEIKKINNTFFSKNPTIIDGIKKLNFKSIFSNNQKYATFKKEPSAYNVIYYKSTKENDDSLAIVKIQSSETKPRFLLAYNSEYFEKEDIIYFLRYIFYKKNIIILINRHYLSYFLYYFVCLFSVIIA